MSDTTRASEHSSEQSERLPPLPHEQRESGSGWGMALPALLTVGGGIAALWLLENQTGAVSRGAARARDTAEDLWHDAGEWAHGLYDEAGERASHLSRDARHSMRDARRRAASSAGEWRESLGDSLISAGAKAAGIAGVLKALGGGAMSTGASRAAKLLALKQVADYAGSKLHQISESAGNHPPLGELASSGMARARSAGHEGSARLREAYAALRGQRHQKEHGWGAAETALLGATVLGAGVAAAYLFSPADGAQRRRALRLRTQAVARRASELAAGFTATAREWTESAAGSFGGRFSGDQEATPDEALAGRVRQKLAEMLSDDMGDLRVSAVEGRVTISGRLPAEQRQSVLEAARGVFGVREVEHARPRTQKRRNN